MYREATENLECTQEKKESGVRREKERTCNEDLTKGHDRDKKKT